MAFTLQQLSDIEEIKQLKHRYFRSLDTADWDLLEGMFTDDIAVEYRGGGYRVELSGDADMRLFLKNSFHAGAVAMHHGVMPEISFTGEDSAEGIWTLHDIFIDFVRADHTYGSAVYRDRYIRQDGRWKIARTEYDRTMEVVQPLHPDQKVTTHLLGQRGMPPEERIDISHMIKWG